MGNPLHYSLELPQRCLQLIKELWPYAEEIRPRDTLNQVHSRRLFFSMSLPIISLPVERIERYKDATDRGYADDMHLDPRLATAVTAVLGGHQFKTAPFFMPGTWSFASRDVCI